MLADPKVLRRVLLAQQGLLAWGKTKPWRETETDVGAVLRRLEAVQLDPVNVIERNHHLVFRNRIKNYQNSQLEDLYPQKSIFEYWAQARCILPIEDYAMFEPLRQRWKFDHPEGGIIHLAAQEIRKQLKRQTSLPARAFDSGEKISGAWGFTAKATSQALEFMWEAGEICVASRKNEERSFALTKNFLEKIHKTKSKDASLERMHKFVNAYGIIDSSCPRVGWQHADAASRKGLIQLLVQSEELIPLEIPTLKRKYFLSAKLLSLYRSLEGVEVLPEVFFLSPLDNLIWRRERIVDLFGFDYKWEIYVPPLKRKYGAYVLPVLMGEQFVGRLHASANRSNKTLEVKEIFWEGNATKSQKKNVNLALEGFAHSLGLKI